MHFFVFFGQSALQLIPVDPGGTEKSAVRHLSAQLGAFDDQLSKAAEEEKE